MRPPKHSVNFWLEFPLAKMSSARVLVISWPERISRIPLPYWLTLLLAWEAVFILDYFLGINIEGAHEHLVEFGCLILFFALVTITIVYCSRVLMQLFDDLLIFVEADQNDLRRWYESILRRSYEGPWPILFGIGVALAEAFTAGPTIRQFSPAGTAVYYLRLAYESLGFFFLGMGIWALLNVLFIPIGLARFKIKVSLNQLAGRGLQALGQAYFKMSLAITATFLPLVIAAILSPVLDDVTILAWLGIGAISIFGFFLLPQIGIHRIMAEEKENRLMNFAGHLEDAMEKALREPSSANIERLRELFEVQSHLKEMNDWPFNVHTVWQLITALLIPVALAVLEIFF